MIHIEWIAVIIKGEQLTPMQLLCAAFVFLVNKELLGQSGINRAQLHHCAKLQLIAKSDPFVHHSRVSHAKTL